MLQRRFFNLNEAVSEYMSYFNEIQLTPAILWEIQNQHHRWCVFILPKVITLMENIGMDSMTSCNDKGMEVHWSTADASFAHQHQLPIAKGVGENDSMRNCS